MSNTEKFVKISEKLNQMEGKFYQIIYNEETLKVEHNCVSYDKKVPELLIMLQLRLIKYVGCCAQFTLQTHELDDKYLRMMGILFIDNDITKHSLNLVNVNGTNNLEIHLMSYNKEDGDKLQIIQKIEKFPGNDEIINYLLELLSHEKVQKIFD